MKKITKKDNFEALLKLIVVGVDNDIPGFDFDALTEFCENEITLLDNKAAKAKERAAKKKSEADEIKDWVREALTEIPQTREDLLVAIQEANPDNEAAGELTTGKLVSRLTALIGEGVAVKETVSVGESGAKRKVTVYALA